jgi:hypothetical protein
MECESRVQMELNPLKRSSLQENELETASPTNFDW